MNFAFSSSANLDLRFKVKEQMEKKAYHFSHRHPLKLTIYKQTLNLFSPCPVCKLKPSDMIYSCTICQDYFLHKKCFEMPKKIDHVCHKTHSLTLVSKPSYFEGHFVCNACGEKGDGFSYNCSRCGVDLHILCALLPLFVKHESHAHKLDLTFESPYSSQSFSCGICGSPGSRHWLYRCKLCEFNAHLNCARGVQIPDPPILPPKDPVVPTPSPSKDPVVPTPSAPPEPHTMLQQQRKNNVTPRPLEVNRSLNNELTLLAVQQMIVNNSNALAQALLSGRVCGDNKGLHLLIEWISALHNNSNNIGVSGTTGGDQIDDYVQIAGGGGVGQDSLPPVVEGGSGGQDSLEAVIIGGGGGGGGSLPEKLNNPSDKKPGVGGVRQDSLLAVMEGGSGSQDYTEAVPIDGGSCLPQKINHPFDKKHDLTLLFAYGEGRFRCDACWERGNGYCYHCQHCGIDLHVSCAMLPLTVTHDSHVCTLRLVFNSTNPNNKFSCDICRKPGSRQWLYRCKSCGFNAHLKCAAGDVTPPVHQAPSQPQGAAAWGRPPPPIMNSGFPTGRIPVNKPSFGVNRPNTAMAQGLMRLISNVGNIGIPEIDGGEQDYQQLLLGDGNGVGFLGALFGG